MKIVIAGSGKVGRSVAALLSEEGNDVTVIDRDADTIASVSNDLDVICVEGNAADPESLRGAGVASADLLLAATEKDEVNMVCGIVGRKLGAKHVIARIRDPQYLHQVQFLREALGLSQIVNPEYECAKEISRILRFPGASRVDAFSKGSVEIAEHKVSEKGVLNGLQLKDLSSRFGAKVLVALIERDGSALIPNGNTVLQAGDRLSITGASKELRRFFVAIGEYKRPVRRVIIMGGGRTAVYLTRLLEESGIEVTVVERDREQCDRLCDLIPEAHIVCGDATYSDVLQEDGIATADGFVALTGDDGDNIITSLYANSCKVEKVVTKVNHEHFSEILNNSGLDSIVSPKEIVAEQLARYVRALGNSADSSVETLYRLVEGKVEVLEFIVHEDSACTHVALKDLKLRENILISALIRGNKSIIPDGNTVIQPGDHAIVVTAAGRLRSLDQILENER
ncbi:MAG: Trk system potassium transporter TrkA [Oscillospiraceae bacterium]|nr:Trk system potassium transporter TrkA [Oscillospiraceae bacterium]MBQ9664049.1 Trk system potassium transporter TrkA [Oscillospiraceae bacterium]